MNRVHQANNKKLDRQQQLSERKIDELVETKQWDDALVVARQFIDEHHGQYRLDDIIGHVRLSEKQLRAEDSGNSWCFLGLMYRWGQGGVEVDEEESFKCFDRAAQLGHAYGLSLKALALERGKGVAKDVAAANVCFVASAEAGCRDAMYSAAETYKYGSGVPQSYLQAAIWYSKSSTGFHDLSYLLQHYPLECCPFGVWQPSLHFLVPPEISTCMIQALLVCKRLQISRHVAVIIASFVCTGGDWKM